VDPFAWRGYCGVRFGPNVERSLPDIMSNRIQNLLSRLSTQPKALSKVRAKIAQMPGPLELLSRARSGANSSGNGAPPVAPRQANTLLTNRAAPLPAKDKPLPPLPLVGNIPPTRPRHGRSEEMHRSPPAPLRKFGTSTPRTTPPSGPGVSTSRPIHPDPSWNQVPPRVLLDMPEDSMSLAHMLSRANSLEDVKKLRKELAEQFGQAERNADALRTALAGANKPTTVVQNAVRSLHGDVNIILSALEKREKDLDRPRVATNGPRARPMPDPRNFQARPVPGMNGFQQTPVFRPAPPVLVDPRSAARERLGLPPNQLMSDRVVNQATSIEAVVELRHALLDMHQRATETALQRDPKGQDPAIGHAWRTLDDDIKKSLDHLHGRQQVLVWQMPRQSEQFKAALDTLDIQTHLSPAEVEMRMLPRRPEDRYTKDGIGHAKRELEELKGIAGNKRASAEDERTRVACDRILKEVANLQFRVARQDLAMRVETDQAPARARDLVNSYEALGIEGADFESLSISKVIPRLGENDAALSKEVDKMEVALNRKYKQLVMKNHLRKKAEMPDLSMKEMIDANAARNADESRESVQRKDIQSAKDRIVDHLTLVRELIAHKRGPYAAAAAA
jgi:hypothetical protein